jgi:AraC-like DNA-binding protein
MYRESATTLPHVLAWRSVTPPGGGIKRILPDGCMDVIWMDGRLFLAGPDTTAQVHETVPGTRVFGVRFAAGTGPPVLGVPADELTDRRVPLDELWPARLVSALSEAPQPLAALEAAVRQRWAEPDRAMVEVLRRAQAGQPVDAIAAACGLSARHLQRRVRAAFGYGPKMLARIARLQRAVRLARRGTPFADVSAAAGFADQAHLSRDVKALAGVPLSGLLR